ncbi:MAG: type II toxin-antitoxin system HicB family antitoxin [Candidimonas sp.]|nr:MAG: type II toxin-antitoxin system HicB family antitoxin [Candidimonas sp.]TAM19496.1 MAG: type II toxin-antitoxin system HicB family antitoxin [Candidimonas sp.]TAM75388.1 MAG: type II toxin-antitoxin system HicB family antitoxin [Candidimonas sp.]
MNNVMNIKGYQAVVSFDPKIEMFRGEFVNLNGGADFYATDVAQLKREGAVSLKIFLDLCKKKGLEPHKAYSGKFVLRIPAETHEAATVAAQAAGKSLNQWLNELIGQATRV